ncbi:MAG: flavodoxin-dependent (E)-4-hydroxy-3-methylbut-2-enyl-diphosphate synthase, partial [Bacteroidales bacterium]|nr:flavodoxin-dependent (E)-4-hydroxy-3-methylbut-2-enyl-diphosphate synthase [Bacteroidales bacterium]
YISGYCPVFSTLTDGPLFRREVRTIPGCNLTFPLVVSRDPQHVSDLLKADVVLPNQVSTSVIDAGGLHFYRSDYTALTYELIATMQKDERAVLLLETTHRNGVGEQRAAIFQLMKADCTVPVVLSRTYQEDCQEDLQLKAAADLGLFFMDGLADGICLHNEGTIPAEALVSLSFGILQAARKRVTKTEYISCPGCGRTLFDLQQTIARVKAATSHLTGLKIGIMGCIVNGPGEMADADYGYVGAARGKISLYKGKVCIEKNIPEEEAVDKLIALIKANGEWKERP